jgi:hypothetical protein
VHFVGNVVRVVNVVSAGGGFVSSALTWAVIEMMLLMLLVLLQLANLAAISAMAKAGFVPVLPKDKPFGKLNKAAPQGDYSLKATLKCIHRTPVGRNKRHKQHMRKRIFVLLVRVRRV